MAGKTEVFNPVKIIATVIAQAEIVGVQAPFSPDVAPLAPSISRLPNDARREVDRDCVHPLLKLGNGDTIEPALTAALKSPLLLALAAPFAAVLAPFVPAVVAARKASWAAEVQASAAEHQAAFDASWQSYRHRQSELVDELLAAAGIRDPLLPPSEAPFTVCVTMATGQEGTAVVKALSHLGSGAVPTTLPNLIVRALVRNPESAKAKELAKLPRVEVVQADSVDESSLAAALDGADAAYLCTTLNNANAGRWSMCWGGGKYEVEQGIAFAAAASKVDSLKQVVYGTAPLRKWPEAYRVEPPIHYAAKWKCEEIVKEAGLVTAQWPNPGLESHVAVATCSAVARPWTWTIHTLWSLLLAQPHALCSDSPTVRTIVWAAADVREKVPLPRELHQVDQAKAARRRPDGGRSGRRGGRAVVGARHLPDQGAHPLELRVQHAGTGRHWRLGGARAVAPEHPLRRVALDRR